MFELPLYETSLGFLWYTVFCIFIISLEILELVCEEKNTNIPWKLLICYAAILITMDEIGTCFVDIAVTANIVICILYMPY